MAETELNVVIKAKELAFHSFKLTSNCNHFPKKYRHSLVDHVQKKSLEIYDTLLEANTIDNKTHRMLRCETITKAITCCNQMIFYIELSMNLQLIRPESAEYWSRLVTDVKRMSLAWRKKESI
jgi:hypothetical protein